MQCQKYHILSMQFFITVRGCLLYYVTKHFNKWDYATMPSEIDINLFFWSFWDLGPLVKLNQDNICHPTVHIACPCSEFFFFYYWSYCLSQQKFFIIDFGLLCSPQSRPAWLCLYFLPWHVACSLCKVSRFSHNLHYCYTYIPDYMGQHWAITYGKTLWCKTMRLLLEMCDFPVFLIIDRVPHALHQRGGNKPDVQWPTFSKF